MTSTPIRPVIRTGLLANRPSAGSVPAGDGYLATDAGLAVSDGAAWRDLDAVTAAALTAHDADTTSVHGIADTAALVLTGDARLTDARTPAANTIGGTGAAAARPSAAAVVAGYVYVASDTREVSRSDGSAWTTLGFNHADAPVSLSERALYFDFTDSTTFARGWTVAAGTAPVVSGGVATPFSTAEHIIVRAAESVGDCEAIWKQNTAASVVTTGASWAVIFKYLDSSNFLMARWSNTSHHQIQLYKQDGGTFTQFGTPVGATAVALTSYWLRARIVGDVFSVEWWTTDPAKGGSPSATHTITLTGGDAIKFGAGIRGKVGFRHASAQVWTLDEATFRPLDRPMRHRDVQVFNSSGTWTKPDGAARDPKATVTVTMIGGGAGGGAGARRASGTATSGGAGGSGGAHVYLPGIPAALFSATETVGVGSAGAGAAAVTTDDTNGSIGGAGGQSTITIGSATLRAAGGLGGAGGNTAAAAGGGASNAGMWPGPSGGAGNVGAAGSQPSSPIAGWVTTGGGGGGGISATPAAFSGGNQGSNLLNMTGLGGAIGAAGGTGPAGNAIPLPSGATLGSGGGGGGASIAGAGGAGGAGMTNGGGGGGGGSSLNGFASGAGGAGGAGYCAVITEWGG